MEQPNQHPPARPEVVPGERIFLSQVRRADLPDFARWFSDLELTAYIGAVGMSFMPDHEDAWFAGVVNDQVNKTFGIIVRETGRLIGTVNLHNVNHSKGTAELGIAIGEKSAWNQGYGTEAVRLMCDYGFAFLGLHVITLWHVAFNQRGHRAYLKAGFREAGRVREAIPFGSQRYDNVLMDITRTDFGPSTLRRLISQVQDTDD